MFFGSERAVVQTSPFKRMLWTCRGDFHIGRWMRHFHLEQALKKIPGQPRAILDAGCGTGQDAFAMERHFPQVAIEALDFSENDIRLCIEMAAGLGSRIVFKRQDLQTAKFERKYDLILVNSVFCTIRSYENVFQRLVDSLSPGGRILLLDMDSEYNHLHFGGVITLSDAVYPGFSKMQLENLFRKNGLQILESSTILGDLGNFSHHLFSQFREKPLLLNLLFPFLLFLGFLDSRWPCKEGSGILLVGQRPEMIKKGKP